MESCLVLHRKGDGMILISNDMPMPTNCRKCAFRNWKNARMVKGHLVHDEYCKAEQKDFTMAERIAKERPNWCPLVEVYNTGECKH